MAKVTAVKNQIVNALDFLDGVDEGSSWSYLSEADDGDHICEIVGLKQFIPKNNPLCMVLSFKVVESENLMVGVKRDWFRTLPPPSVSHMDMKTKMHAADIKKFLKVLAEQVGEECDQEFKHAAVPTLEEAEEGIVSKYIGTRIGVRIKSSPMKRDPSKMFTNLSFFVVE